MAYLDEEKLFKYIPREKVIELTDDDNLGSVDSQVLEAVISKSTDEFENYLRDKFLSLPDPLPGMLESVLADIVIYNLYKRRFQTQMPESITQIYNMAINKLEKIRDNVIDINLPKPSEAGFIKINKTENDRLFGKDRLDLL